MIESIQFQIISWPFNLIKFKLKYIFFYVHLKFLTFLELLFGLPDVHLLVGEVLVLRHLQGILRSSVVVHLSLRGTEDREERVLVSFSELLVLLGHVLRPCLCDNLHIVCGKHLIIRNVLSFIKENYKAY